MITVAKSHSERLGQAGRLMLQYWLPFIVIPVMIALISSYILLPVILLGAAPLLFWDPLNMDILATVGGRMVLILITTLPLIIAALISRQIVLYALKDIFTGKNPTTKSLLLSSLKTLGKFFWLGLYTWMYVFKYLIIGILLILGLLPLSLFSTDNRIIMNASYMLGLAGGLIMIVGGIVSIVRQIRVLFVEVAWIDDTSSAKSALTKGLEVAKQNWRDTLILFGIILGLSVIANFIVGDENILYSVIIMLVSSFTTIFTYLLYKHLQLPISENKTLRTSSEQATAAK